MSDKKLSVIICSECGEVEYAESGHRWRRSWDGKVTHSHPGEKPHWPSKTFPAEEVEVIPAHSPNVLSVDEAREVSRYLEGSGREEIQTLWLRLRRLVVAEEKSPDAS